ncbi:prephenate dehydratase [Nakamurella deserti]|uniref:prephenate dehydratase n=1 Tax=Nakamurella deserti TaxID=2164074 RepID=UPI000DBE3D23|nr:prephenate dehydratase [Nakamurella deserti]
MTQRWAYLGPAGTFTEQATLELRQRADGDVELHPAGSVGAAIADVRAGAMQAACVPIENSVEGAVPLTLDELTHGEPLVISAEAYVTVRLDLLVRAGTSTADIRKLGSHPHGHAQVRSFVTSRLPAAESVVFGSTAAAAAAVAAGELDAAAAAPAAGRHYGLVSAAEDIGEIHGAVTRFVLLRLPGPPVPRTGNDRTSLVVYVQDEPGSLLSVLAELANRGINLTRLESRPARSELGKYFFLLDADGHIDDPAMADAVAALHRRSAGVRFLGSYPRGAGTAHTPPAFASPAAFARARAFVDGLGAGR